jgi:uncharacterized caspase-like protein
MATEEKPSSSEESQNRSLTVDLPTEFEPAEQGRSLVVVIGINDYAHHLKLKNAVKDAIGIQQTLIEKFGFIAIISPLLNEAASKKAIESLVQDRLYKVVKKHDTLIVFFAGHGETRIREVNNKQIETGYLIPVDATQSWSERIEIDSFLHHMSALPARHILVILDSCHSGFALGQSVDSFRSTITPFENELSKRTSRRVITSALKDQKALDNGPIEGHSLFTGILIDGLKTGKAASRLNGSITSSGLGLYLQQQVEQAARNSINIKQTPDFGSFYEDDRGEMVIYLRNKSFDTL